MNNVLVRRDGKLMDVNTFVDTYFDKNELDEDLVSLEALCDEEMMALSAEMCHNA